MGSLTPEQNDWLIRPLLDAGLGLDRIRDLMFRLCFEAITSEHRGTAARVGHLTAGQPAAVRAAWTDVIDRMLAIDARAHD